MMGVQHKTVGIGFGIATAMYIAEVMEQPAPGIIALGACVVGSMVPDIDHDRTKIGSKRKVVTDIASKLTTTAIIVIIVVLGILITAVSIGLIKSNLNLTELTLAFVLAIGFFIIRKLVTNSNTFKWMTKHRGLMHTLIPPAILFIAADASSFIYWNTFFAGACIGYLSHLLADMLTVEGCPILWPIYKGNIRILKLKTKNASTWIAAVILAVLPVIAVYGYLGVL